MKHERARDPRCEAPTLHYIVEVDDRTAAASGVTAWGVSSRARAARWRLALAFGLGPGIFLHLPSGRACAGAFFGRRLETGLAQAIFIDLWQSSNRFSRTPLSTLGWKEIFAPSADFAVSRPNTNGNAT